jgi:2-polyprenyl-3-methyl-5-hydroxy-6-metoxy-1,4-benzoquinol methylase
MKFSISLRDVRQFTHLSDYKLIKHQKRKKALIKLIHKILPPGSSILDIGSANGDISTELSLLNFKVEGIGPLSNSFENAKKLAQKYKQNISFMQTRVEEFGIQKKYDLLVMGEILEHFYEPEIILSK